MMNEMDLDLNKGESEEDNNALLKSRELVLPAATEEGEYVLECWKVEDGSLVRGGETVALACLQGADGSSGTSAPPSEAKHRRPTRRKRPTVSAPAKTNSQAMNHALVDGNQNQELKSIKLPPKEKPKKNERKNGDSEISDEMETESKGSSDSSRKLQQSVVSIAAPIKGFLRIGKKNEQSGSNVIAMIEPCSHPVVVDGLCGVCSDPVAEKSSGDENIVDSSEAPPNSMSQVTVSGGLTFTVSEQEGQQMARQNAERLRNQRKLSLILDLDHTLVHATADMRARQHLDREDVRSLVLPITEDGEHGQRHLWMQHFVKLRPKVKEFINKVLPLYEIGVYTAGTRQYAEQIAIVLCRHVVGAERDQIDLDQLRYEVSQAEADLNRQQADIEATRLKNDADGTANGNAEDSSVDNKRQHQHDESDDKDDNSDGPKKKKRKVTFVVEPEPQTDPPPERQLQESNVVTAEDVERLKNELVEAERLEKEATEMRQRLFGSRIVSRTDVGDLGRDVKSLKRIFPCGGTMAAVVDDREDVWANAKDNNNDSSSSSSSREGEPPENLLLVRPYHWQPFVGFADINNASGADLAAELDGENLQEDSTEEHDIQLLWTADVLERLHTRYYSKGSGDKEEEVSVPELLSDMRREVFHGDNIVLSGLIPLHRQSQDGNYNGPRPPIVRYAEGLGANILPSVTPAVTFVIAAKDGTDKTHQARRTPGCAVVKLSFLMECFWSLSRRDPRPHLLATQNTEEISDNVAADASGGSARVLLDDEDESDEDEDDFAAEFEKDLM